MPLYSNLLLKNNKQILLFAQRMNGNNCVTLCSHTVLYYIRKLWGKSKALFVVSVSPIITIMERKC